MTDTDTFPHADAWDDDAVRRYVERQHNPLAIVKQAIETATRNFGSGG